MIKLECQECPYFNNSCSPYDQISIKFNCDYLFNLDLNLDIIGTNGESENKWNKQKELEGWNNISYHRYIQTSLDI